MLIYDYQYGNLPINIKSTTTKTSDNTGNLAMLVYAYTDSKLDLTKQYNNGEMSRKLYNSIKNKNYNKNYKKDYYFIVINKENTDKIIINSCKGLSYLTPNNNNLPFQVKWSKNKHFKYKKIKLIIEDFILIIKTPKPSWREEFLNNIRSINN